MIHDFWAQAPYSLWSIHKRSPHAANTEACAQQQGARMPWQRPSTAKKQANKKNTWEGPRQEQGKTDTSSWNPVELFCCLECLEEKRGQFQWLTLLLLSSLWVGCFKFHWAVYLSSGISVVEGSRIYQTSQVSIWAPFLVQEAISLRKTEERV